MLLNSVYIRCVWIFAIATIVFYFIPMLFDNCNVPVLSNGATLYDLVYFNCMKFSMFFGSMLFSTMAMILESNFRTVVSLHYMKYLSYTISAMLFVRLCFHFHFYEQIPIIEIFVHVLFISIILLRMWYTIGNLKHLINICLQKLKYH